MPQKKVIKRKKHCIRFTRDCDNVETKKKCTPIEKLKLQTPIGASTRKISPCKSCRKKKDKKSTTNGELKRQLSPFNRFGNKNVLRKADQNLFLKMPAQSKYRQIGLSSKEKSYVINTCQTRSSRYVKLKMLAANAIQSHKIFTIYGKCNVVRRALIERGWIEKITPNKMNLTKIRNGTFSSNNDVHNELERLLLSNLVEKYPPKFIWQTREDNRDTTTAMRKEYTSIVNKLPVDAMWTTKQGLCSSMKRNYWFYIENIAEVNAPRTYNCYDVTEVEGFVKDFQITACTSLLKWVLSMVANDRPVFSETGKVSMNVVLFALNRCKEYLYRKQNKDIDQTLRDASRGQWNVFIQKYERIISRKDIFTSDKDNKLPLYLCYAKFLLKEIHKYRPQLSCEGCHNIWIIKPTHWSRGRGIRLASTLTEITQLLTVTNPRYVVQKYIEEPLLIHSTKFDIRQYYLVTSTYPLVIWMYRDCYLKFSSQKYNLKNYHESIHLTNNAVQKKYKNCTRHIDLPQNNMWDLEKYKDYLNKNGKNEVWDNIIYPGMKRSIISIMLSCQDYLSICKNRFELYGCDFILDKEYKPWLIEINACPDLNATTHVTAKICPAVVSDIIKVVIDHANDPKSPTGKFECVYRQPMTLPRYGGAELGVRGYSLSNDYFYKGKIKVEDTYEDADIEEETDIRSTLTKLKQTFAKCVKVESEADSDTIKETSTDPKSESEYELSVAASTIIVQSEKPLDLIISEHTFSSELDYKFSQSSSSISNMHSTHNTKSETDIKSLSKKLRSRCNTAEAVGAKPYLQFSQLDDEPPRHRCNSSKTAVDVEQSPKTSNVALKGRPLNISLNDLLQATTRIVSFFNEKEREYCFEEIMNSLDEK